MARSTAMAFDARMRPARRFATALLVSVLAHLFLSSVFTAGSPRGSSRMPAGEETQQLVARLHLPERERTDAPRSPETERVPPVGRKLVQKSPARAVVGAPASKPSPPNAGASEVADPTYYSARQLDVYPMLLEGLDLANAQSATSKGYVLLLVLLDAAGAVDEVSLIETDRPGVYDEIALRALRSARFSPAFREGRAVRSRLTIQLEYGADTDHGTTK